RRARGALRAQPRAAPGGAGDVRTGRAPPAADFADAPRSSAAAIPAVPGLTIPEDDDEDFEPPDVGDRDIGIAFVTHSSMRGLVPAVIAAAVLCEEADGIVHDEEADELIAAKDALAYARELIASIGDDLD